MIIPGAQAQGESAEQLATAALESRALEVFSKIPMKQLRENKLTELNFVEEVLGDAETIVLRELIKGKPVV